MRVIHSDIIRRSDRRGGGPSVGTDHTAIYHNGIVLRIQKGFHLGYGIAVSDSRSKASADRRDIAAVYHDLRRRSGAVDSAADPGRLMSPDRIDISRIDDDFPRRSGGIPMLLNPYRFRIIGSAAADPGAAAVYLSRTDCRRSIPWIRARSIQAENGIDFQRIVLIGLTFAACRTGQRKRAVRFEVVRACDGERGVAVHLNTGVSASSVARKSIFERAGL